MAAFPKVIEAHVSVSLLMEDHINGGPLHCASLLLLLVDSNGIVTRYRRGKDARSGMTTVLEKRRSKEWKIRCHPLQAT